MNYSNGTINQVSNKLFGSIFWAAEQVDNEYAFLTVTPIEIYGQELEENIYNLIHMHISSLGESATVDIKYMKKFEEPEKYYKFEKDMTGRTLNYRVLIQNGAVRTILYNFRGKIRELECVERKYKIGEIINIEKLGIPDVTYGKIIGIPIQTLSAIENEKLKNYERTAPQYEIVGHCKSRYFEELLGFIDIELIPNVDEKPEKLKRVSIPICESKRGIEEYKKGNAIIQKWKENVAKKINSLILSLKEKIELVNKSKELNLPEKTNLLENMQKIDSELLTISENEMNEIDPVFFL